MQKFTNGKRRFYCFMDVYAIRLKKIKGLKFDDSTTLKITFSIGKRRKICYRGRYKNK